MTIAELNALSKGDFLDVAESVCGSSEWGMRLEKQRPFQDLEHLQFSGQATWNALSHTAWQEAFAHHPRIGDLKSLQAKFADTSHAKWAAGEQSGMDQAQESVIAELAQLNDEYFKKFENIFIICATGLSASAMLQALKTRLPNSIEKEMMLAAAEQAKIIQIRIAKLCQA